MPGNRLAPREYPVEINYKTTSGFNGRRRNRGTTIAEMPLAMWIIIMGIFFPILILGIITLRFGFFWNACREAASQAAKCPTFEVDSSQGKSAVNTADTVATLAANSFSGISIVYPINVYILQTDVSAGTSVKNSNRQKLITAADTDKNIYEVQVELNGLIAPLVPVGSLGSIPGLSSPFPVTVKAQYSCEVPQGLDQ